MPLDDGGVGRGAKLGNIHNLQGRRRHQVAHQRIADGTAHHTDQIDRHAEKHPDRAAATCIAWRHLDLQAGENRNGDQLHRRRDEETTGIKRTRHQFDGPFGDFRPHQGGCQPAGQNKRDGLRPEGHRHPVGGGISVIACNPERHTKPHAAGTEQHEVTAQNGNRLCKARQRTDQHTGDHHRPPAETRHQQRCRKCCHHRGQELQRERQRRKPGHGRDQHADKRGIDDVDVHCRHRQCLRGGKPQNGDILD